MVSQTTQKLVSRFTDWRWRLNNLYWIVDEKGQRIPFRMNWAQERLYNEMHYLNVILKARQLGFTTFIQLFMLDACMFNSDIRAGTIAHTREDAEAFFRDKVKFPYDNLPEGLRQANPATEDSARKLSFANNSTLRVGTSLRSGTFQYLHVSEYGKICAKYPEKAREIRTGAFNTVHAGQIIFVESTAEGQEGDFYEMCQTSQSLQRQQADLTSLDFKFFFFPWFNHPDYILDISAVLMTKEYEDYFVKLYDEHGILLNDQQKAWYIKKAAQQRDDMKREFPSTPEEAFEASIEGAYYGSLIAKAEQEGRICDLPMESVSVDTWWDLGINDMMSIGFVQRVGPWLHFIDYYENNGEGLEHYARVLQAKQKEHGWVYGDHIWPHDGKVKILDEKGRKRSQVMADLGYRVEIVERGNINQGIEMVRDLLPTVRFDRSRCDGLVKGLRNYRKKWDEDRGAFLDKPLHNWASHPADMVRTGAMHKPSRGFQKIDYPDTAAYV